MYKIIDENLRIAACNISDLTAEMVSKFLAQWETGANIGSLSLFFDRDKKLLVLNADNKNYDTYLELARDYLRADDKTAAEIREKAPDSLDEVMMVLDNFKRYISVVNEIKIVGRHGVVGFNGTHIGDIFQAIIKECGGSCSTPIFLMSMAYNYGMICGKRAERAKKKGVSCSA